jgi:TATA-box binding protein (TBP) (component of TFIID and TFIIIB)
MASTSPAFNKTNEFHDEMKYALDKDIPDFLSSLEKTAAEPPKVSTMTIICKTNIGSVDIQTFKAFMDENPDAIEEGIKMSSKTMGASSLIFKWSNDKRNYSCKVFTNGLLHITGVRDIMEALIIAQFFCVRIDSLNDDADGMPPSQVIDINVCMIVSYFAIPYTLNLTKFFELWRKADKETFCKMNVESRPGIQIKLDASVFIYSSGKIGITGAKKAQDITTPFKRILSFIEEHHKDLCTPLVPIVKIKGKRGRKKKEVTDAFYGSLGALF